MAAAFLTIASGAAVSSAFALTHAGAIAIHVPSHAAGWGAVRVEFAATSGGPSFSPFLAPHAATVPLAVWSGTGPGLGALVTCPTAYGRVTVTNSVTAQMSFTVTALAY